MGAAGRALALAVLTWLAASGAAWAKGPSPPARPEQQVLILLRLPPTHFRPNANYSDSYGDGASQAARRRIASRIAREHGLTLATGWPMPLLGLDCFVLSVPEGQSPAKVAETLAHDRAVEWSEPMHVYAAESAQPNDPLYRAQPVVKAWRLDQLRELATGRNVRVAVIDSAVDAAQPDLAGQFAARQDFTSGRPGTAETHGTGVAGVIAAVADNQIGIAGVAPGARLMALRACWQQEMGPTAGNTVCDTLSLAKAMHYAVDQRAQVINMSLAGPPDILLGRLIDTALARGIVVVGAADPVLARGGFPASHPGVVAVSVSGGSSMPGTFAAPGRNVPTTQPGGRFGLVNGSSFAAAHVSGLFALMRERDLRGAKPLTLVKADVGGDIDACATLARGGLGCANAPIAYSAAPRP
jgi:subtilisin family serine protease